MKPQLNKIYKVSNWYNAKGMRLHEDIICKCCNKIFNCSFYQYAKKLEICPECDEYFSLWVRKHENKITYTLYTKTNLNAFIIDDNKHIGSRNVRNSL